MSSSGPHLSLLHTGDIHCPTFEKLIAELAPDISYTQYVREDLLRRASEAGYVTEEIAEETRQLLNEIAEKDTDGILMTCSTLGTVSDQTKLAIPLIRVDRALAAEAFFRGRNILVLVAAPSTLEATTSLFAEEAHKTASSCPFQVRTIDGAWDDYLSGDLQAYHSRIAREIADSQENHDVIALGQISMNPALDLLDQGKNKILTSPALGLQAALTAIR